jgi:hypothetical protein
MQMPGRKYSNGGTYRYGFNGQEKSTELNGDGNSTTAEFWQYDARLGRRWNTDPKPITGISSYAAFLNNPIYFNDPLGDTCIDGMVYDEGKGTGKTLETVTVVNTKRPGNLTQGNIPTITIDGDEGGLWENTKDITGKVVDATVESVKDVLVGVLSAGNAFATDNVGGAGRQKSNAFPGHPISQKVGERVGDGLALIWGGIETIGGGIAAFGGGVSFIIPGIGQVTSPAVCVGGIALATLGLNITVQVIKLER